MNEMILERLELLAERAARLAAMGRVLKSELDDLVEEVVGEIEAEEAEDAEAMDALDSEESMDLSEEDL
jgi:hypothetical protein